MNNESSRYFNGYWYRLCGKGYYENTIMGKLHRNIWEAYNGPIPEGYDVHHKDGDKSNNNIDNLELLSHSEHSKHHNLGKTRGPLSEEHRQKISQSNMGKVMSPESIAKRSLSVTGQIRSEESKQRMSNSAKKRGYSQSSIEAMRLTNLGGNLSEEHKAKISQAHKGRVHTEQSRKNMSQAHKGLPSPKKIEPTQEMREDMNNNIACKDFMTKYNLSKGTYYNIKKRCKGAGL